MIIPTRAFQNSLMSCHVRVYHSRDVARFRRVVVTQCMLKLCLGFLLDTLFGVTKVAGKAKHFHTYRIVQNFGRVNFWWIVPSHVFGGENFGGSCITGFS